MIKSLEKKEDRYIELEKCVSVICQILQIAADENDEYIFKELFPVYIHLKRDFKDLMHINFIDCGIEFYAKHIGLELN